MEDGLQRALQSVNEAFFYVVDIIVNVQGYFMGAARSIGSVVLLIAILTMGLNYAMTGTGLKENAVKLVKAVLFFFIIMFFYPRIINWITSYTLSLASGSVYSAIRNDIKLTQEGITQAIRDKKDSPEEFDAPTYTDEIMSSRELSEAFENTENIFRKLFQKHTLESGRSYTTIAPASALLATMLVAGECFKTPEGEEPGWFGMPNIPRLITGLLCGFFVIFTGALCVLEYCVTFLEFMLVTSVGIILFPLSLWEGSKFMTEKLIGAIVGFFMKLLFCNIAIFLTLYGFMKIAGVFQKTPFTGGADQVLMMAFSCLFFYFISKSGPGLAQSLLTGSPSLNAAGAISAVAGAATSAMALGGMAGSVAKTAGGLGGSVAKAVAAGAGAMSVSGLNGGLMASNAIGAAASSMGKDLTRSLGNTKAGQAASGGVAALKRGAAALKNSYAEGAAGAAGGGASGGAGETASAAGGGASGEPGASAAGSGSAAVTRSSSAGGPAAPIAAVSFSGGSFSGGGASFSGASFSGGGSAASTGGGAVPAAASVSGAGGASAAALSSGTGTSPAPLPAAGSGAGGGTGAKQPSPKESNARKFAEGFAAAAGAHLPGARNPGEGALSDKEEEKKKAEEDTPKPEVTLKQPETAMPGAAAQKPPAQKPEEA